MWCNFKNITWKWPRWNCVVWVHTAESEWVSWAWTQRQQWAVGAEQWKTRQRASCFSSCDFNHHGGDDHTSHHFLLRWCLCFFKRLHSRGIWQTPQTDRHRFKLFQETKFIDCLKISGDTECVKNNKKKKSRRKLLLVPRTHDCNNPHCLWV